MLSDPRSEERYRAGCLTNYQRDRGANAPFEQTSCLDTELSIMMFIKPRERTGPRPLLTEFKSERVKDAG